MKVLYWDGQGCCLFAKRLEKGRFVWPVTRGGSVVLTTAQLSMLLEGIDWRLSTVLAVRAALEGAGVEFHFPSRERGEGVRMIVQIRT